MLRIAAHAHLSGLAPRFMRNLAAESCATSRTIRLLSASSGKGSIVATRRVLDEDRLIGKEAKTADHGKCQIQWVVPRSFCHLESRENAAATRCRRTAVPPTPTV
jgi:hypothetical protein